VGNSKTTGESKEKERERERERERADFIRPEKLA